MPAVLSKVNVDVSKRQAEGENTKRREQPKSKNKDRASSKTETPSGRYSQIKKKKDYVPELNFRNLSPKQLNKKTQMKDESSKLKNALSAKPDAAKLVRKCQLDLENANSKSNFQLDRSKLPEQVDIVVEDIKTFRSVFCDVESSEPYQVQERFFECNELSDFFRTQFPDFENFAEFDYDSRHQFDNLDMHSACSLNNSLDDLQYFKKLLHEEETCRSNFLGEKEIALLKDIVKSDERHTKLQGDDYVLLKEILHGQLKELTQQERVIKIALKKIRNRSDADVEVTSIKIDAAEQPMEDAVSTLKPNTSISQSARSTRVHTGHTRKQEVDIIFKNVPSLEKEIRILRSLGLKLEETLKKSYETNEIGREKQQLNRHSAHYRGFRHCLCNASFFVNASGLRVVTDKVQEYQIRLQTIDELKLEREFFIPTDIPDCFSLEPTNFNKLIRNPELLLRGLKPFTKSPKMKFNFIEQDPMFFNHFLANMCKLRSDSIERHDTFVPHDVDVLRKSSNRKMICVKNGAGDHSDVPFKEASLPMPKLELPEPTSHRSLGKKKKKGCSTPLAKDKLMTPKNSLLKTVLMGTLQLSILAMLVTAILYPDIVCF